MAEEINSPEHIEKIEVEKAHRVKGRIKEELLKSKREQKCSFCKQPAGAEIDDSDIVVCFHCLAILNLHREALKKFLY